MTIPGWYALLLLSFAAFRTWKLLADDTILDKPRAWFVYGFRKWKGNGTAQYVDDFITCPWCLGFWVALGWWGAFEAWPHGTTIAAVPFAIAAIVGLVAGLLAD
jgi:Protein of unknown function (DUF1360)